MIIILNNPRTSTIPAWLSGIRRARIDLHLLSFTLDVISAFGYNAVVPALVRARRDRLASGAGNDGLWHQATSLSCRESRMSANPVVNDACVLLYQTPHTRLPVRLASGFPCALFDESARNEAQNLGHSVPRDGLAYSSSLRAKRSNPEAADWGSGLLRRFAPRNDDLADPARYHLLCLTN